jgi:hypothetical protein
MYLNEFINLHFINKILKYIINRTKEWLSFYIDNEEFETCINMLLRMQFQCIFFIKC